MKKEHRRSAVIGLLTGLCFAIIAFAAKECESELFLQTQLRLARAQGLPTSADEFRAKIAPAQPLENAAPFYSQLENKIKPGFDDADSLDRDICFHPNPKNLAAAEAVLKKRQEVVELVDQAVSRPKCRFDKNWSDGSAILETEYFNMHQAARWIALRGSIAAARGQVEAAREQSRKLFRMAEHAGQEPTKIGRIEQEILYSIACRRLAYWAFAHRDRPAYREALQVAIDTYPQPNELEEHLDDLYMTLWLLDNLTDPEARRYLPLKEEEVPKDWLWTPPFVYKPRARAELIQAEREYRAALRLPSAQRAASIEAAGKRIREALAAYPVQASIIGPPESARKISDREANCEARRQQFVAILRALDRKSIPRSIETKDLLSPFDREPLSYSYNGRQIVITVSGYRPNGSVLPLAIPPYARRRPQVDARRLYGPDKSTAKIQYGYVLNPS